MPFHKKHLVENYLNIMEKTIYLITKKQYNFEFLLEEEWTERTENETFNNLSNNKILETPERKNANIIHQNIEDANLNKEYVFDTFIVGNSNRFAYTASMAVAEKPGKAYNPLFLYGKSGLGKTHLMHSIGNYIIENSNLKVLYISSDKFVNDFINAVRYNEKDNFDKIDVFKNKYRNIDVLMIDDIQFLGNATKGQEEFFHTFNTLYESGKQIILSSDRTPKDIPLLEDRLKSRFEWGIIADISNPDYETRLAILRKKAQLDKIIIEGITDTERVLLKEI